MPLLLVLSLCCLSSSVAIRMIDPMVPAIAREFDALPSTVALLASAFAFPYALGQPILGPLGDALGKVRIIKVCLVIVSAALAYTVVAPSLSSLFAARIVAGLASGGIFPLALAMVGDRFDMKDRQVALSRLLMAALIGQLLGASGSGIIASWLGWRWVMASALVTMLATLAIALLYLQPRANAQRKPMSLANVRASYTRIFANPRAVVCYSAVFVEGIAVFGVFPHLASLLEEHGAGGMREAGYVIAGMGVGGLIYTFTIKLLLNRLGGMFNMIRWGGVATALGLASLGLMYSWHLGFAAFVAIGFGFYMIHNSLQTQATELAPAERGSAVSLHAFFFFLGQASGPVVYALTLSRAGPLISLGSGAIALVALGFIVAARLEKLSLGPPPKVTPETMPEST